MEGRTSCQQVRLNRCSDKYKWKAIMQNENTIKGGTANAAKNKTHIKS